MDADDRTADELVDYLASDPANATAWTPLCALREWEVLYNLRRDRAFLTALAANLETRGLAQTRRVAAGRQLRLTPAGEAAARKRRADVDAAFRRLDLTRA